MQIKILDQVHLSGVRATTLAAGEVVEVSRDLGAELLKKHPDKFEDVSQALVESSIADRDASVGGDALGKAEGSPLNKVETPPDNKATATARAKRKRGKRSS